jgi:hypothetical protein
LSGIVDRPILLENGRKRTIGNLPENYRNRKRNYLNYIASEKQTKTRGYVDRVLKVWMVGLIMSLIFSAPAAAVTREQAHSLPVGELAALILGESGALVIDVERPRWTIGAPFGVSPEEAAKGLPPVNWLRFYFRASAVSTISGTDGLCSAQSVDLAIDPSGKATLMSVNIIYGLARPLSRPNLQAFDYRTADETLDALCKALPTTRQFFFAPGVLDPGAVAYALSQVHAAMVSGGASWLTASCVELDRNECAEPASVQAMAEAADLSRVGQIDPAQCPRPETAKRSRDEHTSDRCFSVHLQTHGCSSSDNIELRLTGENEKMSIRKATFSRDRIVC